MYNVVVKKVHVRYLISWWVSCYRSWIALIIFLHFYHSIHTIVRHWYSLLCADVPLRNYSLTQSQCTRLTDRRTDRQTDGQADRILIARRRLHSMQRGKNMGEFTKNKWTNEVGHVKKVRGDTLHGWHPNEINKSDSDKQKRSSVFFQEKINRGDIARLAAGRRWKMTMKWWPVF